MLIKQKENPELPIVSDPAQAKLALDKTGTNIDMTNFPVHTMRDDLKNLDLGGQEKVPAPAPVFMPTPTPTPTPISTPTSSQGSSFQQSIVMEKKKESSAGGKGVFILALILVLVMLAGGGYYFWMTRLKNTSDDTVAIETTSPADQNPIRTSQTGAGGADNATLPAFSESQANYLSIDMQNTDALGLQATLKKTADSVVQLNATGPIEFILTDKNNNPISFQDFAQKISLTLPENVLTQLNPTFSLYIYANNAQPRLGLALAEKNNASLKAAMTQEEKKLTHDFAALFLDPAYQLDNTTVLKSSVYNSNQIRYVNIPGATNLSLDYTFTNNQQLIIGTSRMTTRAILDYIDKTVTQSAK